MIDQIQERTQVWTTERRFKAPLERVYRAFTDSDAYARWGCGVSYENLSIDLDPRPGGVLHHRVRHKKSGSEWTFFGVYQEVEPGQKLSYSFDWKTDWRELPTPSAVEIRFFDHGDETEVHIHHARLGPEELEPTNAHWVEFLDVLAGMLERNEL